MANASPGRLRLGRSLAAVLIAVALNVVLAIGLDEIFHLAQVYPPWDQPMPQARATICSRFPTGWSSPSSPAWSRFASPAMRPGATLWRIGAVGLVLGRWARLPPTTGGADFGPDWYPWSLAASAIPCTWLAWAIASRRMPS